FIFFFSSRRRHTRFSRDWSSDVCSSDLDFSSDEIIARVMVPMINETIRCLEEGIVASAAEADMGLIYGLGFPPFRGGPLRYADRSEERRVGKEGRARGTPYR